MTGARDGQGEVGGGGWGGLFSYFGKVGEGAGADREEVVTGKEGKTGRGVLISTFINFPGRSPEFTIGLFDRVVPPPALFGVFSKSWSIASSARQFWHLMPFDSHNPHTRAIAI